MQYSIDAIFNSKQHKCHQQKYFGFFYKENVDIKSWISYKSRKNNQEKYSV